MFGWKLDIMCAMRGHDDDVTHFYLDQWNAALLRDHGPEEESDPYEEYGGEG